MQTDALRSHEELTELRGQVSVYEDKIQKLESELVSTAELIKEDPLTHVLNRRGLHDVFHVEMTRCERRNVPLSVAMIDIDDFKRLNDTYGHQAGDAALAHLAKLMRDMLRATDWIARYGGEEFVILMPETDMQQGIVGISRVKSALAGLPVPYKDQQISMTFSAGVTQGVLPEKDTDMLERADRGLYRAKAEGKDRVIGEP
jgi:diguanylate cyclase